VSTSLGELNGGGLTRCGKPGTGLALRKGQVPGRPSERGGRLTILAIEAPTVHARGFLLAVKPWTLDLGVAPLAALSSAISFKADVSSAQVAMLCRSAYTIH
jgi:hypothetical protein